MKQFLLLLCGFLMCAVAWSQVDVAVGKNSRQVATEVAEKQKFKLSGYIQAQFQQGGEDATLKVGGANEDTGQSFNRVGIRRGYLKTTFSEGIATAVVLLNVTDRGVKMQETYLKLQTPWYTSVQAGAFTRPFGYELPYSSSKRESPERADVIQALFPDDSDLGGMVVVRPPATSPLHCLTLYAGLFAGNGLNAETDSRKDFIGHITFNKSLGRSVDLSVGFSYYNGSVYQGTANVYQVTDGKFLVDNNENNIGEYAKREYFGIDAQVPVNNGWGQAKLLGEYVWGRQPAGLSVNKSPNTSALPDRDTYIRQCAGGYIMAVQQLLKSSFTVAVKYDFYDPNTELSASDIIAAGGGAGDVKRQTVGGGLLYDAATNVRITAWYDFVDVEKCRGLAGYDGRRNENRFTLRLQYKF